jgi:adenylosuccinate synthase
MQGLADARIPPGRLTRTYMAIRTFPIRVGNVDGFDSGGWYTDQHETDWENIGVPEERTTVTNRVRRVASFSLDQFFDACYANNPDVVFLSHCDYIGRDELLSLMEDLHEAKARMNAYFGFLLGYGPNIGDIKTEEHLREYQRSDYDTE